MNTLGTMKCVDAPNNNMFTAGNSYPILERINRLIKTLDNLGHTRYVYFEDGKGRFIVDYSKSTIGETPLFAHFE